MPDSRSHSSDIIAPATEAANAIAASKTITMKAASPVELTTIKPTRTCRGHGRQGRTCDGKCRNGSNARRAKACWWAAMELRILSVVENGKKFGTKTIDVCSLAKAHSTRRFL
jgi:hypothetical protein